MNHILKLPYPSIWKRCIKFAYYVICTYCIYAWSRDFGIYILLVVFVIWKDILREPQHQNHVTYSIWWKNCTKVIAVALVVHTSAARFLQQSWSNQILEHCCNKLSNIWYFFERFLVIKYYFVYVCMYNKDLLEL